MAGKTTSEMYPLDRAKIIKKSISSYVAYGILAAVILIPSYLFLFAISPMICYILSTIFLAIFIIIPIYQTAYYNKYFYDVRNDFLVIRKGVVMVRETTLNYDKLQDVYMDQDILDRIFGLWDVHVSTATNMSGAEAHIDGVKHDNANAIKELILAKIRKAK